VTKQDGAVKVRLATPDEFFQYMEEHDNGQYKVWNSELPMRTHGVGAYTSWGALKLWNRKNELLADAAEKASALAMWQGVRDYPSKQLEDAWVRMLWQQHWCLTHLIPDNSQRIDITVRRSDRYSHR
jgi:alpha-mannosidase